LDREERQGCRGPSTAPAGPVSAACCLLSASPWFFPLRVVLYRFFDVVASSEPLPGCFRASIWYPVSAGARTRDYVRSKVASVSLLVVRVHNKIIRSR
jgi:hypothetical protein